MLMLSIIFLLSSNAVSERRAKSILYVAIVITIVIFCFFLCINSYYTDLHCKDSYNISGQLSHAVNMINQPQYLVSLITGFFLLEFLSLFVFTLLYNLSKISTLVFTLRFSLLVSLFLGLVSFIYRYPAFYLLEQLGCAPWGYLVSALLIFLIGNIRLGLESQPLNFSYTNFRSSLLFLLIVALLNFTGFSYDIYSILLTSLGSVFAGYSFSLSLEVKNILTFKALRLVLSSSDLKSLSSLGKINFILTNLFKSLFGKENPLMLMEDHANLPVNRSSKKVGGLIPKAFFMEGETSGSEIPLNSHSQSKKEDSNNIFTSLAKPSSLSNMLDSKLYIGDLSSYDKDTRNFIQKNRVPWIVRTYIGPHGCPIRTNSWGMDYIPCPGGVINHEIGTAGNLNRIKYYNGFMVRGSTVTDMNNLLTLGWCSDGSRSNQPTARNIADILLAAKESGTVQVHKSFFESPLVLPFISGAMDTKINPRLISVKMIIALRSAT